MYHPKERDEQNVVGEEKSYEQHVDGNSEAFQGEEEKKIEINTHESEVTFFLPSIGTKG